MSKLMKNALLQLKASNATVKERLRSIAHKFQNCSEVSAQEVSYHLLSMPLSQCSRANVYINTNPPEQRTRILKPKHLLEDMEEIPRIFYKKALLNIIVINQMRRTIHV